jgi:hypothetical protein
MNAEFLAAAQLARDYLTATGDSLNATVCRALGLPGGKHYLHDLRRRLAALDCPESAHSENTSANGQKGSSLSAAVALRFTIEGLPEGDFTTSDLREHVRLSTGTMSKALRKLEGDGLIERIPSPRPHRYRRFPRPHPDFALAFMKAHGMAAPASALSLRRLPLLANRTLCGMTIEGIDLADTVADMTSRYSGLALPCPPPKALEPMILAVLHGCSDVRTVNRELGKAIRQALAVRRVLDGLPPGAADERALTEFCLPPEWLALLESQGGISAFAEAVTQALGGELHPKEAGEVASKAIEETLTRLRAEGIAAQYDTEKGLLSGLGSVGQERVALILRSYVWEFARKSDLPVRKFTARGLYGKAALEMTRAGRAPSSPSEARATDFFLRMWGKSASQKS